MAVNDFWRALARDLDPAELEAGAYINPLLLETVLLDISTGDAGGVTLAQTRAFFGLTVGTDRGNEFTDLITSLNSLPGTAGAGGTKLVNQERVLRRMVAYAVVGSRQGKIPGNPYNTGAELRARVKGSITAFGGTPAGSLAL